MVDNRGRHRFFYTIGNRRGAGKPQAVRRRRGGLWTGNWNGSMSGRSRWIRHGFEKDRLFEKIGSSQPKVAMPAKIGYQATGLEDVEHDLRESFSNNYGARGEVYHLHPRFLLICTMDGDLVSTLNLVGVADHWKKAIVDGIAIVGAREAASDHRTNARAENRRYRNLHGRATTEVLAGNNQISGLDRGGKGRIDLFKKILTQDLGIETFPLSPRGDDVVGVDAVAEDAGPAFDAQCRHRVAPESTSCGSAIAPRTAAAAQLAGEAR